MELTEYRKDLLETVKMQAAAESEGTVSMFSKIFLNDLQDLNVISDYETCYSVGKNGRKNYRIDGYSFDDYDCSMSLFITDYDGEETASTLTKTDAKALFDKIMAFLDGCINGNFRYEIEISTPVYDLVEQILQLRTTIRKYRFFIITDKVMSTQIAAFDQGSIDKKPIEYNIWDLGRLYKVACTGDGHEPVEIDFSNMTGNGLPCLEASDASTGEVKCYLSVIPGEILANLYDQYGSTLLEGNVRSFLSVRGNVNKNIRKTILEINGESKRMFFAYNNGISATATNVTINNTEDGMRIKSISNLQIVNGGQTTASLSNARYKDKADLSGIYVQMKLTVIPDHDLAQELIPKISRGSNSQNKVSDADFFSNHEFNVRMEKISRRLYAPAINGLQYETHWFFERSRGQYEQEQSKMTKAEAKKYQMQNPKTQKITKTDFAKYRNAWRELPFTVSMGAQKNFNRFANYIVEEWNKEDTKFNEQYYRDTVSIAIMFKHIDKMVPQQDWYEKGYKANIVVYTLAYLHFLIKKQFPECSLNLSYIWDKQKVPDELDLEFTRLTEFIFKYITSEKRKITNVTEWCKKEECWVLLKDEKFELTNNIVGLLIGKEEQKRINREGKKEYKLLNGIEVQVDVIKKGSDYWCRAIEWGSKHKLLSAVEVSFLTSATKIELGRLPSEKQCQRIVNIEAKLIDEGFTDDRG